MDEETKKSVIQSVSDAFPIAVQNLHQGKIGSETVRLHTQFKEMGIDMAALKKLTSSYNYKPEEGDLQQKQGNETVQKQLAELFKGDELLTIDWMRYQHFNHVAYLYADALLDEYLAGEKNFTVRRDQADAHKELVREVKEYSGVAEGQALRAIKTFEDDIRGAAGRSLGQRK